ncbi:MAG: hypothetical protein V1859_11365 [archaeon]
MNKKLLVVITLLFLAACSKLDPLSLVKANSQVKEFLKEYPNADVLLTKISAEQIAEENTFVTSICESGLAEKDYYKVKIMDPDSDLLIYAYIDIQTEDIVCLRKIGKEVTEKESEKVIEKETENKDLKEKEKSETDENKEDVANDCPDSLTLKSDLKDDTVVLEWDKFDCKDFEGYKVVWSKDKASPKYPEDGYVSYITDKNANRFEEKYRGPKNNYGITVLLKGGAKVYSNAVSFEADYEKPVIESYDITLDYELTDGKIKLNWNPYTGDGLQYYKVVWSQTNSDLMYPNDTYISVITDKGVSEFVVPDEDFKEGTNYYRISAIFDGFYDGNDLKRINSNVVKIIK